MIPFQEPSARLRPAASAIRPLDSRKIFGLVALTLITGAILSGPLVTHAFAKTGQATEAKPEDANTAEAIDPNAMEALNKMGTYLRTLKAFQVTSHITSDDVLDDGELITNARNTTLLAVRPHDLLVDTKGDKEDRLTLYDGKNLTVFGRAHNFYATVPAPPTIGEFIKKADEEYGIQVPLVDLFKWGTDEALTNRITSAIDVGPSTVDGITCEHYAFAQKEVNWQIWIQLGDYPLPLKFTISTLTDDARPQHTATLTWNLAPSYSEDSFTFTPPPGAQRIILKELKDDSETKDK